MVFDDFNDNSINTSIWTVDENLGTITESSGTLNIAATAGEWWDTSNTSPTIYTSLPSGDFEVKVKITSYSGREAGLVLFTNDSNAILFDKRNYSGYNGLVVIKNISGKGQWPPVASNSVTNVPIYLRIRKIETTYYFDYSTDDSTYTNLYTTTSLGITPTYIGLYGNGKDSSINVSFDDFEIIDLLRIPATLTVNEENYINWLWQNEVEITGSPSGQLTNYPVNITVPYDNEFMRYDFQDIRFGTDYGLNLPYFLRHKVDGDYAEFIVKIPIIPESPDTIIIYIYAGNDQAQDRSNGFQVFSLFDDFNEEYTVGIDTSKWTVTGGYSGIVDGILEVWSGYPMLHCQIHSSETFGENYIMGINAKVPSINGYASFGFDDGSNRYIKQYVDGSSSTFRCNDNGSADVSDDQDTAYPPTNYHVYEFEHKNGVDIQQNIDFAEVDSSVVTISTAMPVRLHTYGSGATQGLYVDYVYVRKTVANEPAIGELGTWATTTHTDIYQSLLEIPFYHDSKATLCIRPLREDFQALLNITGQTSQLIQALLNITGYSTHNMVQLTQALLEINEDAGFMDSQAVINIGNVYTGSLEIKGKILYKSGQTPTESVTPGTKTVTKEDENIKFVINLGGRIYG